MCGKTCVKQEFGENNKGVCAGAHQCPFAGYKKQAGITTAPTSDPIVKNEAPVNKFVPKKFEGLKTA